MRELDWNLSMDACPARPIRSPGRWTLAFSFIIGRPGPGALDIKEDSLQSAIRRVHEPILRCPFQRAV